MSPDPSPRLQWDGSGYARLVYTYIAPLTLEIFGVLSDEYNEHYHWCDRVKLIKMILHFVYVNVDRVVVAESR